MYPFQWNQNNIFANGVDPDEKSHLIRIYTVCHSVFVSDWDPDLEQWFWPDSKMEESTSETQRWKG